MQDGISGIYGNVLSQSYRDAETSCVAMEGPVCNDTRFHIDERIETVANFRQCRKSFMVKKSEKDFRVSDCWNPHKMKRPKKRRVRCGQHKFERASRQFVILLSRLEIYPGDAAFFGIMRLESRGHGGKDFSAPPVSA